ncbi:site-specific integrase [Acidobacteriota bacterium]
MLELYFEAPFTLNRLREGPSGPYIDGFALHLKQDGYSWWTGRGFLRSAAHLGLFAEFKAIGLEAFDSKALKAFKRHLPYCRCPRSNGGTTGDAVRGAKLFLDYVRTGEGLEVVDFEERKTDPELVRSFKHWLKQHRGASESTQYTYGRGASDLLRCLGDVPSRYDAQRLRSFLLDRASEIGPGAAKSLVTALRMFLRFLSYQGVCQAGLERAIPALAGWRQASLPKYLPADDVQRIIDACDDSSLMGIRDRAIILFIARLGLRAGDVAGLRFSDIDWDDGSVLVSGKGRHEARLPLPQEVGDALVEYLDQRPCVKHDRVFLRAVVPFRPFVSGSSLSQIVARRMRKAGVVAPHYGAHILRHTAATEMLHQGVSLYEIGAVLRHRSLDMTAYYAKVDIELLRQLAQPWPEVLQC